MGNKETGRGTLLYQTMTLYLWANIPNYEYPDFRAPTCDATLWYYNSSMRRVLFFPLAVLSAKVESKGSLKSASGAL